MIIGLTGTNGSGKDTIADFLKSKDFEYHSLSDIIRDECDRLGLAHTRENLIQAGNRLREQFGPGILGQRIVEKIQKSTAKNFVVVSIRNLTELSNLRALEEFTFVFVDADPRLRYKRISLRADARDLQSFDDFVTKEQIEMEGTDDHVQQLGLCKEKADFTIVNDGSLKDLYQKTEELIHGR